MPSRKITFCCFYLVGPPPPLLLYLPFMWKICVSGIKLIYTGLSLNKGVHNQGEVRRVWIVPPVT